MTDVTQEEIQKMLAPGFPVPEKLVVELDHIQARNVAFLLGESYAKWGMELNHHMNCGDGAYPAEVMEMMDAIDSVRDQLVDQGIQWDSDDEGEWT